MSVRLGSTRSKHTSLENDMCSSHHSTRLPGMRNLKGNVCSPGFTVPVFDTESTVSQWEQSHCRTFTTTVFTLQLFSIYSLEIISFSIYSFKNTLLFLLLQHLCKMFHCMCGHFLQTRSLTCDWKLG